MQLTQEQQAIVESRSTFLKVNAFAGAGKSSVLRAYAAARPRQRFLLIAFNKTIQVHAQASFPGNVKCMTSHGMAFARFGARYADAGKLAKSLHAHQAAEALGLKDYPDAFRMYVADACIKALGRYFSSSDPEIAEAHVEGLLLPDGGATAADIVTLSTKLWMRMRDMNDPGVGMLHDGYLKLYQLSKPRLPYDSILFDEYQDANPVTSQIVDAQDCAKVVVGDAHQSLYAFRGAVNAMNLARADETLYLTRTFRFGQPIADVANYLLGTFKGERRTIQGTSETGLVSPFQRGLTHTVIARTNSSLFDEAVAGLAGGRRIHFVGGIQNYQLGDLMDTYNLWAKRPDAISNPFLRAFKDFETMNEYAGAVDDKPLKSLAHVVRKHAQRIPSLIDRVRSSATDEPAKAQVLLTTAHKAKGLEWERVKLADDFVKLKDQYGKPRKIPAKELEEINVLYVAATRAQRQLQPPPELQSLLDAPVRATMQARMPEWAREAPAARGLPPRARTAG